jgi:hypothetical protein
LPDNTVIAVEVTEHTVPARRSVLAEVDRRDWRFPELHLHWVVDMVPVFNVGTVHAAIAVPLVALETDGRTDALLLRAKHLPGNGRREAARQLHELGASGVVALGGARDTRGGTVIISEAPQGGSTAPQVVVEVVESLAALQDNVTKLTRARYAHERHLFVWIGSAQHQAAQRIEGHGARVAVPSLGDLSREGAHRQLRVLQRASDRLPSARAPAVV